MDPHDEALAQRVGQIIAGRWTLRKVIGSGGMAAVYAADSPEGQIAAIKLLHPEMGMRKDIRERFLREAAVMARIVHPGMVTIFEQGQSGDFAYLAMELLTGETCSHRVRRMGRLEVTDVLIILDQVLDVLALAHSMGVVHRDLKPENLFLTQEGRVKVLDFGLARLLDAGPDSFRTRTGAALGTLPYMAPEQALGRRDEVDARTDLFAVGATAFRLLTGRRIHEAPSEAELLMCMASEAAKPLVVVAPDLSSELGAVVDRALAFAKTNRYPDARTMQSDVRALLAGQPPPYAHACRDRDEAVTKVDRQAPNSTRPLYAALPPFTLPPTVVMPTSKRNVPTVSDQAPPTAAQGASIPIAPMSDVVLERKRRRTLVVGLLLLLGMLGVATAGAWYLFGRRGTAASNDGSPVITTSTSTSVSGKADELPAERDSAHTRMRHPSQVMAPLEEPEQARRIESNTPPTPPTGSAAATASPNNPPSSASTQPKKRGHSKH